MASALFLLPRGWVPPTCAGCLPDPVGVAPRQSDLSALCFHTLTNPFSRNSFLFTSMQIPWGCGVQRFQNGLATAPFGKEVQAGVRYPLLRDFRDEDGVRLHGQRIGHAGQRFVEAGEQNAELRRCKS